MGRTAGNGIEGAGEADLRILGEEPKDDRRLCEIAGGFMGRGVPGTEGDGAGEYGASTVPSGRVCGRIPRSGGAGLLVDIRRGRSIFVILLC